MRFILNLTSWVWIVLINARLFNGQYWLIFFAREIYIWAAGFLSVFALEAYSKSGISALLGRANSNFLMCLELFPAAIARPIFAFGLLSQRRERGTSSQTNSRGER